jgi:hypothetical protein
LKEVASEPSRRGTIASSEEKIAVLTCAVIVSNLTDKDLVCFHNLRSRVQIRQSYISISFKQAVCVALTLFSSILLLLQRTYTVHTGPKNIQNLEFIPEGLTSLYGISSQTRTVYSASKDWYVYYKFIDDSTGKLKRMPNIKAGANRYKTKGYRFTP